MDVETAIGVVALLDSQSGLCGADHKRGGGGCGKFLDKDMFHVDHIKPLILDGGNESTDQFASSMFRLQLGKGAAGMGIEEAIDALNPKP